MTESPYDPRYLEGIRLFNDCEFFEAHDVWEELWADHKGPSREFYQGLIQTAVCLYHFNNGNTRGALKLFHGSRGYLGKYRPIHEGVDLDRLFADMETCCAELLKSDEPIPKVELSVDLIPEIRFHTQ